MKVLVDSLTSLIYGVYQEPLTSSISGAYVIDIPNAISSVVPKSDQSVSDLIAAKNAAWVTYSQIPSGTVVYDEMTGTPSGPNVDSVNSTGIELGPNKTTVIYPSGTLLTNPIAGPSASKAAFLHYAGFILYRALVDPNNPTSATPGPSKMLYSYNPVTPGFEVFSNSTFTVSVCQATGPFTNITTPTPDLPGGTTVAFPASYRLKFVNNSTQPYYLSDWILIIHP